MPVILAGEVAVPCNLQPALVEVNSGLRGRLSWQPLKTDVENKVLYGGISRNRVRSGRKQH